MADAYARKGKTQEEFAIYDSVLQELALKAEKIPLGENVGERLGYSQQAMQETVGRRIGSESRTAATARSLRNGNQAFQISPASNSSQLGRARRSIRVCSNAIWPAWSS